MCSFKEYEWELKSSALLYKCVRFTGIKIAKSYGIGMKITPEF